MCRKRSETISYEAIDKFIRVNYWDEKYQSGIVCECCILRDSVVEDDSLLEDMLDDSLAKLEEGFVACLFRKIDERGMRDSECYKRANIDKKLFSKMRNNMEYKPKKYTAVAFAIALKLSMEETQELLGKAGYTLSRSDKADTIVAFFIKNKIYDIFEVNKALFHYGQHLLGSTME